VGGGKGPDCVTTSNGQQWGGGRMTNRAGPQNGHRNSSSSSRVGHKRHAGQKDTHTTNGAALKALLVPPAAFGLRNAGWPFLVINGSHNNWVKCSDVHFTGSVCQQREQQHEQSGFESQAHVLICC